MLKKLRKLIKHPNIFFYDLFAKRINAPVYGAPKMTVVNKNNVNMIDRSNVLKNDGYSNYLQHGVDIYGLQGVKKLDTEMRRSFIIGICIIFIEFSMNISYFMQEMGGDISGMFLSSVAALVPTALLLAETYMLSQTKFEIYTCDELIAKLDR